MKRVFFYLVVLTLCLTLVSATDTTVQVKTVPFKNIQMNVLQSGSTTVYDGKRLNKDSNEYGDATFTFSLDDPYFDLTIFVKDVTTGNKVAYKKLESQYTGEEIYVEVVPSNFEIIETPAPEPEINETIVEETINDSEIVEQEEIPEETPSITGKAIFEDTKTLKTVLYVIGIIVILGIIFFFSKKYFKSKKTKGPKDIKIKKLSELKEEKKEQTEEQKEKTEEQKDKIDDYKTAIEDAQRKIKEAQDEINKLRNQDKIKEVEKRIEQEQKELQRLKGE